MYERKCPECGCCITHTNKYHRNYAVKHGWRCRRCPKLGSKNPFYGKIHSEESRKKMSHVGVDNPFYGKKHTKETRRRMRLAVIQRKKLGLTIYPRYNPDACRLIDEYGKKHGYSFQHAENGGEFYIKELGYWVDGYDTKQNVVIEVYEPKHYEPGKRIKDIARQKEIEKYLKCEFIILNT